MRANNLTISIPGGCKKNCPYCVSNMTFAVKDNDARFTANLYKVRSLAERIGVSHVLITGKGEPFDNLVHLAGTIDVFHEFIIEVQTSYHKITRKQIALFDSIDVLAISVDDPKQLDDQFYWKLLTDNNLIVRLTIVLTKQWSPYTLSYIIKTCKRFGIRQLTIRQPTVPVKKQRNDKSRKTAEWIKENTSEDHYQSILDNLKVLVEIGRASFIRDLHFGAKVYDVNGVSFTAMEYCVESQNGDTMRSLIYQGDGHLYTTWDHPGSIIF